MKYVVIVIFSGAILVFAKTYMKRYDRQVALCRAFSDFLNFAYAEVHYSSATVLDIVHRFRQQRPSLPQFLSVEAEPVGQEVQNIVQKENCLTAEEKALICDFFHTFGAQDEEGSLLMISHYQSLFEPVYLKAKIDCSEKKKLVLRLCALAAAGVTVMLL